MKTEWASCAAPIIRLPISTLGEQDAVLMEAWYVDDVCGFRFVVPAGTRTDGASIPRFLWRICGHPLQAPRVYAALLHDWLYSDFKLTAPAIHDARYYNSALPSDLTRKEADECYYALLRHFGVHACAATIEYYTLRIVGGLHYRKEKTRCTR